MSVLGTCVDMTDTTVSKNGNVFERRKHYHPINAWELFEQEKNCHHIVTSCVEMDNMLCGGVETGKITEFCGDNEKSQISMQLLVNVQIPRHFGGLEGKAIYIEPVRTGQSERRKQSPTTPQRAKVILNQFLNQFTVVTDASFSVERLASFAKGLVKQLNVDNSKKSPDDQYSNMDQFTVEYILSNIQVAHCLDHIELIAASHQLPDQIRSFGQVKLIIVENIANPFRCEFSSHAVRGRILSELTQRFLKIAYEQDLAVVFTNQMTMTRAGKIVPCLGQSWGHSCSRRVILAREGKNRMAYLKKSSSRKETSVSYIITEEGVRSTPTVVQCCPGNSSCIMRFDDILMKTSTSF